MTVTSRVPNAPVFQDNEMSVPARMACKAAVIGTAFKFVVGTMMLSGSSSDKDRRLSLRPDLRFNVTIGGSFSPRTTSSLPGTSAMAMSRSLESLAKGISEAEHAAKPSVRASIPSLCFLWATPSLLLRVKYTLGDQPYRQADPLGNLPLRSLFLVNRPG